MEITINTTENNKLTFSLLLIIAILTMLFAIQGVNAATDVYVDPVNGNDNNPGTVTQPCQTISNGTDKLDPNGILHLLAGTYDKNTDAAHKDYDITITKSMTIQGADKDTTIIDAKNLARIFNIQAGVTVTINQVTLKNGKAPDGSSGLPGENGGAIINQDTLNINNCILTNNNAGNGGNSIYGGENGGNGGAIYNTGTLTITSSTINNNNAGNGGNPFAEGQGNGGAGGNGGAIYNTGTLTITSSTINNNNAGTGSSKPFQGGAGGNGGAIYNTATTIITTSTINNNNAGNGGFGYDAGGAGGNGGAIYNTATTTITSSTINNNNAGNGGYGIYYGGDGGNGGAIYNTATTTINTTTINNNNAGNGGFGYVAGGAGGNGGAIYNTATTTITDSTINNNNAGNGANGMNGGDGGNGGAIYNTATTTITDSTINNNNAGNGGLGSRGGDGGNGGAIYNDAGLSITDSTVSSNSAGTGASGQPAGDNGNGGGIYLESGSSYEIIGNNIINNIVTGIYMPRTMHSDSVSILGRTLIDAINFNRIIGNTVYGLYVFISQANGIPNGVYTYQTPLINAENNWWGTNHDPKTVQGNIGGAVNLVDADPWLLLTVKADPTTIKKGKSSTITAYLIINSDGQDTLALYGKHIPDNTPVTFNTDIGILGSSTITKFTYNGIATANLYGDRTGTAHIHVTVDGYTTPTSLNVVITSASAQAGERTVPMQNTGNPVGLLLTAIIMISAGLATSKRK